MMPRKASKNSTNKVEVETLSSKEIEELKANRGRQTVDLKAINDLVEHIKENLADQVNGEGFPLYVSLVELHEKFNIKPGFSKKSNMYFLNGRVWRSLHKVENPPIWQKYLTRESDGARFVAFYTKKVK